MVCPKCHRQVRDSAKYCHRCGAQLPPPPQERAVNDIYLVAKAAGITIILNLFLVSFLAATGDPFLLLFGSLLGPFMGGILFGLAFLLILEFLGNRFHPFNKDWTLIMAWKRAWENRRYLRGIFLSFALGWWWFSIVGFLIFRLYLGLWLYPSRRPYPCTYLRARQLGTGLDLCLPHRNSQPLLHIHSLYPQRGRPSAG
jgi:hypothetical protein